MLPAIAAVIYLRAVLGLPGDNAWVRLAETATWVAFVIVALGAANAVVFEAAAVGSWQQRVPRLLRDLVRILLVALAAALAYSFIWDREIQGALAALGVTSIVVGLALQEPLGNLFSGLMLLMERPFEIGDSIEVGGVSGTVKEINWRSAHIEALGGHDPGGSELDPEQGDDQQITRGRCRSAWRCWSSPSAPTIRRTRCARRCSRWPGPPRA